MAKGTTASKNASAEEEKKRGYISQSDVPAYSITQALRVAQAIADNYGKNPTKPLRVAQALGMTPGASGFRMICGASIAYGLTDGGYNSEVIAITPLGRRIIAPIREGDDLAAKREALLRPRVVREFLTKYNESKLPSEQIARNVLEELNVPTDRTADVYKLIVDSSRDLSLLREVKGQTYVDLEATPVVASTNEKEGETTEDAVAENPEAAVRANAGGKAAAEVLAPRRRSGRVFITHGRNKEIVGQLKDLLTFGGFTPVVAIEQETVSKPVPDKVLDDMRSCDAAIIHVGTDLRVSDAEGKELKILNQNVLIEIGAALALYGRKFILLVEKGSTLPSNLQGLYEVRCEGEKLDYDSTMRLLKAFNDFRG